MTPEAESFIAACVDLVGRTGGREWQIRYSDDDSPTIWMAAAKWRTRATPDAKPRDHWEAAGATTPIEAAYRLLESVLDGGTCRHCGRVTGVDREWAGRRPDAYVVGGPEMCWYVYDPERGTFRRSCA